MVALAGAQDAIDMPSGYLRGDSSEHCSDHAPKYRQLQSFPNVLDAAAWTQPRTFLDRALWKVCVIRE